MDAQKIKFLISYWTTESSAYYIRCILEGKINVIIFDPV
jgi:hypothetical protein